LHITVVLLAVMCNLLLHRELCGHGTGEEK
jgi:hypothetical protein